MAKSIIIYMAREWLTWFFGCLFFLIGTIFLFSTVEDATKVFPRGINFILEDFWYWLLSYLPWLLPLSCLGASLFAVSFVRKRGEWTAILANGISPWQCFSLVVLIGLVIAWTSDWLIGQTGGQATCLDEKKVSGLKMQIGSERFWYFRSFDPANLVGEDLQLFCYGENGEDVLRVRAARAEWDPVFGWTFLKGKFLGFYSSLGLAVIDQENHSIIWEKEMNVNSEEIYISKSPGISRSFDQLLGFKFMDNPVPYLWLHKKPKDMSISGIEHLLDSHVDSSSPELIPYRLRKAQLWWNGPACLVAIFVGLTLGSSGRFTSPGKLAGVSLLGALTFYIVRTLCDSLGEQGFFSPILSASIPYFLVGLGTVLYSKYKD